jgi:hypothetical protein
MAGEAAKLAAAKAYPHRGILRRQPRITWDKVKRTRSPVPTLPAVAIDDGTHNHQQSMGLTTTSNRWYSQPPAIDGTITTGGLMACQTIGHAARLSCGFIGELTEHYDSCQPFDEKGKTLVCPLWQAFLPVLWALVASLYTSSLVTLLEMVLHLVFPSIMIKDGLARDSNARTCG